MKKGADPKVLALQSQHTGIKGHASWKSKGLGMTRVESCGCELHSYPGGLIYRTGCSHHKHSVEYVCPVCGAILESRNHLKDHRWQHGY